MSILTPEVASLCGAIDSDAIVDGDPYGAQILRPLIRSANRTIVKAQHLFNCFWPENAYLEAGSFAFDGVAPPWWTRAFCPVPILKRPGLRYADVWLRMSVPSGQDVQVFIATSSRPAHHNVTPDLTISGAGAFANHLCEDVPLVDSDEDFVELWLRGIPTTTLANTTYGAPNTRSSASPTGTYTLIQNGRQLDLSTAAWNSSGTNSLAQGGHFIRFVDANGAYIGGPHMVTGHYGITGLYFTPPLQPSEMVRADDDANGGSNGDFEIYECPRYAISCFGAMAQERT